MYCKLLWPNDYYHIDELFPIKQDYFENVKINIPNNYKKYLERQYGKNYMNSFILSDYHHINIFYKIIINITNFFNKEIYY